MNTRKELGKKRCAMRWRILEALVPQGKKRITMSQIAIETGKSLETVRKVINGRLHTESVLQALRLHGVPESLLFAPQRMVG